MTAPKPEAWAANPPAVLFVTPLTYGDALGLVDEVMVSGLSPILLRDRLAHLLMAVDVESRKQECVAFGEERA